MEDMREKQDLDHRRKTKEHSKAGVKELFKKQEYKKNFQFQNLEALQLKIPFM